jgi:hypothetical protein
VLYPLPRYTDQRYMGARLYVQQTAGYSQLFKLVVGYAYDLIKPVRLIQTFSAHLLWTKW